MFIVTVSDAKKLAKEKAIQDQARVLAEQMLKEREQNREDEPASSESQE